MTVRGAVLFALFASLALVSGIAGVATAASDDEGLAAKSFREGEAAFARREFAPAALAFERAARLVPHPSPWLNAAEAWEKAGDLLRAAEDCDRALALPSPEVAFADAAKERLARLERALARIQIEGDRTFHVRMDDGAMAEAPFARRVEAGRHRVVWTWSGDHAPVERELWVEVAPGESKTIALPELLEVVARAPTPEALAPPTDDLTSPVALAEDEPPFLARVPTTTWIAFGVGATALVAGATLGGLTLSAQRDYEDAPTAERADTFFARRRLTNIAFVTAGVAAAAGAALWFFDDTLQGGENDVADASPRVRLSFGAGQDGAGLVGSLRY